MELNEQTNSWIDEQSYKDEFERVEQFKKRNEFINMKILWLSGNPALYKRKSMIDGGYGAQNEAYMSRSAEKWVRGLCFNELGVCG